MTRNRASAKKAGSSFERLVADYLAETLNDDRIDRRVKAGNKDRGDVGGVRTIRGGRVVLEVKDYGGRFEVSEWLRQAEVERANDDAAVGAVVAKRRGVGTAGEQVVFMTLETFALLLEGGPDDRAVVVLDPMTEVRS
jgi:hypothetical protein